MSSTKSFDISKHLVWEGYRRVKANGGVAGVDGESLDEFDRHLKGNLYKIWNRLSSGSYLPPAVKEVEIAKKSGGKRALGIPTVSDRIAQMVVKLWLEPALDPQFHVDSYGYRPGRSAKDAVAITRKRCWHFDWMVEFDIKGAFDNIDHALLMKAVKHHVSERWILLYIERWLTAPFETQDGSIIQRTQGTPQGGVISPLLMNLFMHYVFDKWMARTYPHVPFARYADDAVVHCHSQQEAEALLEAICHRLEECLLTMHPEKSNVVYCQDGKRTLRYPKTAFTFLGFTFRARAAVSRTGRKFTSFLPAVSESALKGMRQTIKSWRLHRRTYADLEQLARDYNPVLRGWWNYYGSFYKTKMRQVFTYINIRLAVWVSRKYKKFRQHKSRSFDWLNRIAKKQPNLFHHWRMCAGSDWVMGAV